MRNIVEHGQISGSSETTVMSGCSAAMRCTMWISVPTPSTRPGRGLLDPVEDPLGRADLVGELDHVVRALGVHDHLAVRVVGAELRDVLGAEALVHRAVALPQQERRLLDVALLEPAELEVRVPHPHRRLVVAHVVGGVAPEVLVGEEQHLDLPGLPGPGRTLGERPLEDRPCVRRGAHRAAVLADERLQRGRGVHVGDRARPWSMSVTAGERLPALLDLVDVGHVGHRAAGVEVGEDDPLVVAGEHVGRLGHEVHAAEHDVGGVVVVRREPGELEGVAAHVGPLDDLVTLVVVAEDRAAGRRAAALAARIQPSSSSGDARV